jgi:hypothetical protein
LFLTVFTKLVGVVGSGGTDQFLANSSGDYAEEIKDHLAT